ncbi:MAG: hypothetical protein JXO22_10435, partial [Phycisphaerae bacterium]|nr:hypothetical protein [Phycisphaerae bacterium]
NQNPGRESGAEPTSCEDILMGGGCLPPELCDDPGHGLAATPLSHFGPRRKERGCGRLGWPR